MEIGNASHSMAHIAARTRRQDEDHPSNKTVEHADLSDVTAPIAPQPEDVAADNQTDEHNDNGGDDRKGVLRLLESGHFKGVADVRLRINFFDEISAGAQANGQAAAAEGIGDLSESIVNQANTLPENEALNEETRTAIGEALATFTKAVAGESEDGNVEQQARLAFDQLVATLSAVLTPPAEEPVLQEVIDEAGVGEAGDDEPTQADETTGDAGVANEPLSDETPAAPSESVFDLEGFITTLTETFDSGMTTLLDSIATASALPDVAPAEDNSGKAYEKFLAIYQELAAPPTEPEPVAEPTVSADSEPGVDVEI